MTENDVLRMKFESLGYKHIAPFIKAVSSELSAETWGRLLHRNGKIDTRTLMIAAAELRFSTAELRSMLWMRNEKILADLITEAHVTTEEALLLAKYRKIANDAQKKKLVLDLLEVISR